MVQQDNAIPESAIRPLPFRAVDRVQNLSILRVKYGVLHNQVAHALQDTR
jgi:hypothetical protein